MKGDALLEQPGWATALQRFMGHSQPIVTGRYSHIAQSERIKRERTYDHLDQLDVRVRRMKRL